ncbi:MAG TPA: PfkB family carbohydrate kinase, partial [bacterium]|nr:PfkB family carbohydrate kinase [bacterium]
MTVVVLGGVNVDLLARAQGPLRPAASTPGRVAITAGGAGRNVAENLARLGVPTVLIAAAGDDALTDAVLARTAAAG